MADINIPEGAHKRKGHTTAKSLRVDLTPMVDLAFLLITFFMLTTTLLEQKAIGMQAPKTGGPPQPVSECQLLNILTDSLGQVYCWEGLECKTVNKIALTGEHNLKEKIKQRQQYLRSNCLYASGKQKHLICLIKLLPGSHYDNMVKLLDEVATDSVETYAIQDYSADELKAVNAARQLSMK